MKTDKYTDFLAVYNRSRFQNFENFVRAKVDLVDDDIWLVLNKNFSTFTTYEIQQGVHTFEDICEVLFNILQPEYPGFNNVIVMEFDDINMKTRLVVRPEIIPLRFDETSSFSTILGFNHGW